MKLITNENNIDALKILISANEVKSQLNIEHGGGGLVPCLVEGSTDLKLFVVNSACLFLHQNAEVLNKKSATAVEGLLDWEANVLRPVLSLFHATKKNGEDIKKVLKARILPILEQSDDQLTHYPKLHEITSANDIVIWCDLYPIWIDHPEIIGALPRIKIWMEYLNSKQ